ncbi:TRZ/ATZ family hydrolase [Rhodocyclus tenuis]|nr:TRZ/ATZ family hydrolase [Rhodocyclus tenuis]
MLMNIDLLIDARWIVPVEPVGVVLENHAVAIDAGKIVALMPRAAAAEAFTPRVHRRLDRHVLIPGLINLHTHAAMSLLRGLADDLPLREWLENHIWPAEGRHVSAQFVYDGTRLAAAEMLRGGITCFNDMYFYPKAAADAAVAAGIRAAIGIVSFDFPTPYAADPDDYLLKGLAARDALRDEPLISFCLAPHAPYTVGDRNFARVLTLAEQIDAPIHVHIHETAHEIEESIKVHGVRPLARLHRLGLLSPGLIGVHAVHLTGDEIALLAAHGCSLAHCPTSNLKLASGIAPVSELLHAGVNVGLGTDGAASNNRLDLFQEMRLAALLAKGVSGRADVLGAHQALHMATLGGARALGLDAKTGSLLPGKAADLCAVAFDDLALSPCFDPVSHLVYVAGREHVSDVWVDGQARVEQRLLLGIDESELIKLAALWQNKICPRDVT